MPHITIKVPVPEGQEDFFLSRQMMVTPVNSKELMVFALNLEEVEEFLRNLRTRLATLRQALETRGDLSPETAKVFALLIELAELHTRKIEFVRAMLRKSALTEEKGKLQ